MFTASRVATDVMNLAHDGRPSTTRGDGWPPRPSSRASRPRARPRHRHRRPRRPCASAARVGRRSAPISRGMLRRRAPSSARRRETRVPLLAADALALPFRDRTFAAVTSAFLGATSPTSRVASPRCGASPSPAASCHARHHASGDAGLGSHVRLSTSSARPLMGALVAVTAGLHLPARIGRASRVRRPGRRDAPRRSARRALSRLGLGTIALHVGVRRRSPALSRPLRACAACAMLRALVERRHRHAQPDGRPAPGHRPRCLHHRRPTTRQRLGARR